MINFKEEYMKKYDYLIVGTGLFGSVFAQQAKAKGKKVHKYSTGLHGQALVGKDVLNPRET